MLLRAEAITKSFGPNDVLRSITLQVNKGDSIGLIGMNGAGKTTLLRILLEELRQDTGELTVRTDRIGYLSQFPDMGKDATVREVIGKPHGRLANVKRRMEEIEQLMASGGDLDWNRITTEYAQLETEYNRSGLEDQKRVIDALGKVGLSEGIVDREIGSLSGGEVTKVMLTRVLVQAEESELLFLDEPTSHLDIETVEWLEDYLLSTKASLIVISHDRYFLDKVATRVLEIEAGKGREYSGNYSAFVRKKAMDVERQVKEHVKYVRERDRQIAVAEEQHRANWYNSIHKTREKMIDRMEEVDAPLKMKEVQVRIQAASKSGKNVVMAKGIGVRRGEREVLKGLDLDLKVGDKLGIFGPNGQGKTTLIKALLGELPLTGELWMAPGAKIGYFAQGHDILDLSISPEEQLLRILGNDQKAEARALLARLLITGEKAERAISTLSGGERGRVALALLLAEKKNLLILDEPTNYLDIQSRHAVESALRDFPGTLLVVTHDRYFLDSVCNRVGELRGGKLKVFNGTYSEMKGRQNVEEIVQDADEYKALASFTNWVTKRKYQKGDRVLIAPAELKSFQWALDNNKLKRTGGRQRKKVAEGKEENC